MKISGFDNMICLEKFEYCSKVDEHEMCQFVCYVREKDIDSFLNLNDSDCTVEDDEFSFAGHIKEIALSKDISGNCLEVTLIGKSYLYDEDVHNRIFQDPEKTISDILSKSGSMSDVNYAGKQDKPINEVIIQKDCTDWVFIKYLANLVGEKVFAGEKIVIAAETSEKISLSEEDCIDYKYCIGGKGARVYCRLSKNYSLGSIVSFYNKEFLLCGKKYLLDAGQFYFEYVLYEKKENDCKILVVNDELLEAVVSDNNDPDNMGKVKVTFSSDTMEDCMENDAIWIEQESFYSTKSFGTVFIPAVDDKVLVSVKNGKPYVFGSLRTESFNEAYQSQNNKCIILDDNVFIEYNDGSFVITNKDNSVSLSDKQVSVKIGDKSQMIVESGKANIQIDKTNVEITGDISGTAGKILIEAKNEASISATNINIKGKSGVSIN